jgi:HD-GYP domain-containing protein (c-di-GMP phosphodiesterase class II)
MRFRTRAFLICFVPFAILLAASFWMVQGFVQSAVQDGLRTSLRTDEVAIARVHAQGDLQNSRFLNVAGENAALKAGMQLLLTRPGNQAAKRTVEDQLRELGEHMGFDFLMVSGPNGTPLAGVVRQADENSQGAGQLVPVDLTQLAHGEEGLLLIGNSTLQVVSVPMDENEENIGSLSVGVHFDFSEFTTPAVLTHNGKVIQSNIPNATRSEIETAVNSCTNQSECDLRLRGVNWISVPMQSFKGGYVLRTLENADEATGPVQTRLRTLFLTVAMGSVLVALICSIASSRSIVRPIAVVVSHLRNAERTGVLPEFESDLSSTKEIRELAESYNRAAVSVRHARESLQGAYVEFVGSLANALDARDQYTSGHSWRVSQLSSATAAAMGLGPDAIERIRIGALLHDIGKIGIADSVLQKPGRLTDEEFALVKQHPVIGRRILEGVQGLSPYLEAVELHHENWDGTGYPKGQSGEETPIDARIIHVADAYDAMTTDRSYRRGSSHEQAVRELRNFAGTQFDSAVVEVFANLPLEIVNGQPGLADDPSQAGILEILEAG